eukprot:SAG22_NODE_258_length_13522_cov_6.989496_7_plen_447_part_00
MAPPASGGGAERKRRKRQAQKDAQRDQKDVRMASRRQAGAEAAAAAAEASSSTAAASVAAAGEVQPTGDIQNLKQQQQQHQHDKQQQPTISAELAAQLSGNPLAGNDATEFVTRPAAKKQKVKAQQDEWGAAAKSEEPVMSKTQAKKLRKLQERKEKEAKREQFLEALAKNAMDPKQLALLQSGVGQVDTKKMKIRREMQRQKAGLAANQSLVDEKEAKLAARLKKREQSAEATVASQKRAAAHKAFYPSQVATAPKSKAPTPAQIATAAAGEKRHPEPDRLAVPPQPAPPVPAPAQAAVDRSPTSATDADAAATAAAAAGTLGGGDGCGGGGSAGDAVTGSGAVEDATPSVPTWVPVRRNPGVQSARMELPVCAMEQDIMEAVTENDVVIIVGETGSGKTTQLPQFLYEAGYGTKREGMIGCTQVSELGASFRNPHPPFNAFGAH